MADADAPDSGSSSGDTGGFVPTWLWDLKPLVGIVGVLTAFAAKPREFVLEKVWLYLVGGLIDFTAYLGGEIEGVWLLLAESLVSAFDPLFAAGASVVSAVVSVLLGIQNGLVETVAVAGPAAPLLVILFWVGVAVLIFEIGRLALKLTPYVGQLV